MSSILEIRQAIKQAHLADEQALLAAMSLTSQITQSVRDSIRNRASQLITAIREDDRPALLEVFLAEYGLSTNEGVALMCLAEALMRVPDAQTMDELIEDKIAPSAWSDHQGNSDSLLVNASTWGLMLTGKVLSESHSQGLVPLLQGMVKRLGEPVIRAAVKRAMKELGGQFVLGETIQDAVKRGAKSAKAGYTFSYDMLGEAALTEADASKFYDAYHNAIRYLAKHATAATVRENPGISIKLSALHPRYEVGQKARVMNELVERTLALTVLAKDANMGLNIDAEEADRLDLSLDVIEAVLKDPRLAGWDGFGVVVQAYGKRANLVIDWLYQIAQKYDRKIMVRLVKGAYWDSEIKRAQQEGLSDFPVFTKKSATDCSYLYCAEKLLQMTDRIYPQFATHNANSVAAIVELAPTGAHYEFQRLHGMGEALHRLTMAKENVHCRIYAPVGPHRDLLAYLVRRLLENGANSSFVNQIVDTALPVASIADDPIGEAIPALQQGSSAIAAPKDLYGAERLNARGWDLHNDDDIAEIDAARNQFKAQQWQATPLLVSTPQGNETLAVMNPALAKDQVGTVTYANQQDVQQAITDAQTWQSANAHERIKILQAAGDLLELHFGELFAVLTREAGKTPADAIAELREAVDFLRFYALEINKLQDTQPRGIVTCISPWNFPIAIFVGQIAAALAAGNGVLAKPAEQTPICAFVTVQLLHKAGVPVSALQLLPGQGAVVGAQLTAHQKVRGVCFTGSTMTAQRINRSMAENLSPTAPLIAETGGLNAMIVDSTALPEQAIKDVIASAFQSAGQRCSALRVLYLQEDIAATFKTMLFGAMDELVVGDPWQYATDVGPVIDQQAHNKISQHIAQAAAEGRLLKQLAIPSDGTFIGPAVISVAGINDLAEEIFGPVLHIATFKANEIEQVLADVNATGYGLTFGLHTRIDNRVELITSALNVGNIYVNRNQIGAIVGSQPFGGEGLSGTGPKAGGPHYVPRFALTHEDMAANNSAALPITPTDAVQHSALQAAILRLSVQKSRENLGKTVLPGPTGESNVLSMYGRGVILCLGPTLQEAELQADIAKANGCHGLIVVPDCPEDKGVAGFLPRKLLSELHDFDAVVAWTGEEDQRQIRVALAAREGAILPLITEVNMAQRCILERHICVDTTAAGGNAALLAVTS